MMKTDEAFKSVRSSWSRPDSGDLILLLSKEEPKDGMEKTFEAKWLMNRNFLTHRHGREAEGVIALDVPMAINPVMPLDVSYPGQLTGIMVRIRDFKLDLQVLRWEAQADRSPPVWPAI